MRWSETLPLPKLTDCSYCGVMGAYALEYEGLTASRGNRKLPGTGSGEESGVR